MARQLKLPVMLPSWVESTWEAGLDGHVTSATGDDIITIHRCPPLRGHTVTVTGLDERARQRVKELCAENGGTYSGELTKDICTHLLVGNKQSELLHAHVHNYNCGVETFMDARSLAVCIQAFIILFVHACARRNMTRRFVFKIQAKGSQFAVSPYHS